VSVFSTDRAEGEHARTDLVESGNLTGRIAGTTAELGHLIGHTPAADRALLGTDDALLVVTDKPALGRTLMSRRTALRGDSAQRWVRVMCTGHREASLTPAQRIWARQELERVAAKLVGEHGMRVAIHGGANGADLYWAAAAHDGAQVDDVWAYLPFPTQTKGWTPEQVGQWHWLTGLQPDGAASLRWFAAQEFSVGALHHRNDAMIADADAVVAVLDPGKTGGGTVSVLAKVGTTRPVITLDVAARTVRMSVAL